MIGNLNWKKFAERVQQQLVENTNLTIEQKTLMEINVVVAYLRSHQFEIAKQVYDKVKATNTHHAMKGIGAYFLLKDKKFDEALKLVESQPDHYSHFLKAHVLLC